MKEKVVIVGGGTAGIFLAAFLDTKLYEVTIYEKKAALGRKFLVAGDGGFNLTHGEGMSGFKSRFTPETFLENVLDQFTNTDLRTWLKDLGIPTFVGSSGRVFPEKGIKPVEVLKSIEAHLIKNKIQIEFNRTFSHWNAEHDLVFDNEEIVKADYVVFALGGGSWKVTGSDGTWSKAFEERGVDVLPFRSSNCAFKINWNEKFIEKHEGTPLKNISILLQKKSQKGEVVLTKYGIEGNAIYALSPLIQNGLEKEKEVVVYVDLKPPFKLSELIKKMGASGSNVTETLKKKLKLPKAAIELIKAMLTKEEYMDVRILARCIKRFPLTIVDAASVDEAISTSGGVALSAVDSQFELKELSNHFCIGEMLDWDAPTGGYLIQACASMGVYLARELNSRNSS